MKSGTETIEVTVYGDTIIFCNFMMVVQKNCIEYVDDYGPEVDWFTH